MNELIKVSFGSIGGQEVNSVNLRDVWTFVESKRHFSDWKESRLKRAIEGVDFITIHANVKALNKENSASNKVDYIVTLDLAKSICMLEDNEKGDVLRQYFIDCEKKLLAQPKRPETKLEWMQLCVETEQARLALEAQNKEQQKILEEAKPKLDFYNRFMTGDKCINVGQFAKLYDRDGLGPNKMFELLRKEGYLMSKPKNSPYQIHLNKGFFKVVLRTNEVGTFSVTLVTPEGVKHLIKKLDELFNDNWIDRVDENVIQGVFC